MTDSRVLQVAGIPPRVYEDDLVRDKLLIHFLRPKNGGGCDIDVRYPTKEEGVATVTFDQEEVVKRMLGKEHTMEIGDRTYPLAVRRPLCHTSEFSLPIRTTLNLKYFNDVSEVTRLLQRNNLRISSNRDSKLLITGNFHDLRRCRDELYGKLGGPLLRRPNGEENFHLTSGDTEKRPPRGNNPPSNVTNSRRPVSEVTNDASLHNSALRQRKDEYTKPSANISSPKVLNEPSSPLPRGKSSNPVHTENVHSSSSLTRSLDLETGVYSYVTTFEKSTIVDILRRCFLSMKEEKCEKWSRITLTAKSPYSPTLFQYALDKISELFTYYTAFLHRDSIKLPIIPGKAEAKELRRLLLRRGIYSWRNEDSLNLIGASDNILRFKQEWEVPSGEKKISNYPSPPTEGNYPSPPTEGNYPSPPTEGLNNMHIAPRHKNLLQTKVSDGKPRARDPSQGTPARGRGGQQQVNRRASPSTDPQKEQWR